MHALLSSGKMLALFGNVQPVPGAPPPVQMLSVQTLLSSQLALVAMNWHRPVSALQLSTVHAMLSLHTVSTPHVPSPAQMLLVQLSSSLQTVAEPSVTSV